MSDIIEESSTRWGGQVGDRRDKARSKCVVWYALVLDGLHYGASHTPMAWFFPACPSFGDMTEAEREDVSRERREATEAGQRGRLGSI